jgi:CDP-diacylglycerol---glycerol-3-phosphate 3-phosphatidyltransferase
VSGSLVSPEIRQRVRGIATPIAVGIGRLGLTPNHLTLAGFAISIVAAIVIAQQAWLAGALLLIFGGVFDLFDGALARATGQASRLGAFMDSVFDRAGEGVVYVGIAAACAAVDFDGGTVLSASAMAAAFMVSYARAKSESLGYTPGSRMASIGLAPREVRIVLLTAGLIVTGVAGGIHVVEDPNVLVAYDGWGLGRWHLAATLLLITILAAITAIQRIVHVVRQSSSKEHQ